MLIFSSETTQRPAKLWQEKICFEMCPTFRISFIMGFAEAVDKFQRMLREIFPEIRFHLFILPSRVLWRGPDARSGVTHHLWRKQQRSVWIWGYQAFHPIQPSVKSSHKMNGDFILSTPNGHRKKAFQEGEKDWKLFPGKWIFLTNVRDSGISLLPVGFQKRVHGFRVKNWGKH